VNGGGLDAGQDNGTPAALARLDDATGRGPLPDDPHQAERSEGTDPLAKLAAVLLTLSPADRERLAAMLKGDA